MKRRAKQQPRHGLILTGSDGQLLMMVPVAPGDVSLVREGGEGGNFSEAELVEVIRQFMSERL